MVSLLILVFVIGLIYWLATLFLPHPFPQVVLVIGVVILLISLLQLVDSSSTGNGINIDTLLLN